MTAKILNLDNFAQEKSIVLKNKTYSVNQMTVGDFIESAAGVDELAAAPDTIARTNGLIDQILKYIPDLPKDVLLCVTAEQMFAVLGYIRGEDIAEPADEAKNV